MAESSYVTIRSRRDNDLDSTYGSYSSTGSHRTPSAATHDTSRVNYHVKDVGDFAKSLEDSAARAFPNRGRSQRYQKVQALLLHWRTDDLFVLPELQDLERCFRDDYSFETDIFSIPEDNPHLELMMRVGQMIKEHESDDTLFVVYYGGHARIDESRQSTWCATRQSDSPWLQWSAIQTLLERSLSDVLILLDCCAGAASATFPNGTSITETISASSWDAIAPDPGRYSFTSALLEVMQSWKYKTYSAAMLHAEILARLKHPRPVMLNGRNFETRSTPVHFMMTSNHRAPSIEIARSASDDRIASSLPPPADEEFPQAATGRSGITQEMVNSEPNEDTPHVMISLALEDNQNLDINEWENWLGAFPAIAKYVKVQGVFKSHSTLLLLSVPVMVWNLLPDNMACNFVAFIRSNNLAAQNKGTFESAIPDDAAVSRHMPSVEPGAPNPPASTAPGLLPSSNTESARSSSTAVQLSQSDAQSSTPSRSIGRRQTAPTLGAVTNKSGDNIANQPIRNQNRSSEKNLPMAGGSRQKRRELAPHVQTRLEDYFQEHEAPNAEIIEFLASTLGVETSDIHAWFAHRRDKQQVHNKLVNLPLVDQRQASSRKGVRMILAGHLNNLLEIVPLAQILIIDLRSVADYDKSHVHGAINLRAPVSFILKATFPMIERTLRDEMSRETFNNFPNCECVVFYDRRIEYDWECPTARGLINRLRAEGWQGQAFILKGPYREFSDSFDKYITGQKMTGNAKKYLESLQERSLQKTNDHQAEYNDWLTLLESEDRVPPTNLAPASRKARVEEIISHQKDLEDELKRHHPNLYRKFLDLNQDTNEDIIAAMVEPFALGIEKITTGGRGGSSAGGITYPDKLAREAAYNARDLDPTDSDDEPPYSKDSASQKPDVRPAPEQQASADSVKGRFRNMLKMPRSTR